MSDKKWMSDWRADLVAGVTGVQLVEVDHPLEIYVGVSDLGQARIQIRSMTKPKHPALSDLVLVDRAEAGGGVWTLSLTLQDRRFSDVFLILAGHLVERSRDHANEQSAFRAIDDVLNEWQRLLRRRPAGVLSMEELRGLIGEIWLLLERFGPCRTVDVALAGWLGPLGSPQDFWYQESGFHEAKSIGPSSTAVKVSSAEQLDAEPLELIVLQIPQVPETTAGARNLVDLVSAVRQALHAMSVPDDELELRLARLGVDLEHPFYADTWFKIVALETFDVSDQFPAIRASALAPGVNQVQYRLERAAIGPFRKTVEEVS